MKQITCFAAVLGSLWLVGWQVAAQGGVTVTFPSVVAAGPDYATDVLGDPWDMNSIDDISIDPLERKFWSSLSAVNDSGSGAPTAVGGTMNGSGNEGLSVLYKGHYAVINNVRNGRQFPIDTSFYRRLSFKMRDTTGNPVILWSHRPWSHPSGEGFGAAWDFWAPTSAAYQIRSIDLTLPTACGPTCLSGESWASSSVGGLRIDPDFGATSQSIFFDWVRLTAADGAAGAAMQTISWSGGSGTSTVTVTDAGGTTLAIASGLGTTSFNWNYGVIPPGNYTLTVVRGGMSGTKTFRINNPPSVRITDPDETGGQDYATVEQLDPWDMNNSADVDSDLIGSDHLIQESVIGGEFLGRSDGVPLAGGEGDPEVYMLANTPSVNRGTIDSTRYRYLSFNLQVDRAYDLGLGSVGRALWGSTTAPYNLAVSEPFIVWPGNRRYTIDLASLQVGKDLGIEISSPSLIPWSNAPVRQLRIDPHEFAESLYFHLDDVKVAEIDKAAGSFTIKFAAADADAGDTLSLQLFYDTDRNTSNGMTPITGAPLTGAAVTSGQYVWNTTGVPDGVYYVYALVSDTRDSRGSYSTGPVKVVGPPPPPIGDEVVLDLGASGLWGMYNNWPNPFDGIRGFRQLHASSPTAMAFANLDGNATRDLILEFPGFGVWVWLNNSTWFRLHASDATRIVTGDLDGNGTDEVLIDFPGLGIWVWRNNSSWMQLHPQNPNKMIVGDLDGNGKAEAIIDFPGAGLWIWTNNAFWRQLHPMSAASMAVGDLDGGGRADLLVGFSGYGLWVWRNDSQWFQLHGTTPPRMTTGDLDGNGKDEAIIDFPGFGLWVYANNATWFNLHALSAEDLITADIDKSGRDDVIIDFGSAGVWAFKNNGQWVQIHTASPELMAGGNLDGL